MAPAPREGHPGRGLDRTQSGAPYGREPERQKTSIKWGLLRLPVDRLIPPKRTSNKSSLLLGEQRLELSDCALDLLAKRDQDRDNRLSRERANSLEGDVHVRPHFQFEFGFLL
jgi:hypothetical protein